MNRVYGFIADKARNYFDFTTYELWLIGSVCVCTSVLLHPIVGVVTSVAVALGLKFHERFAYGRADHFELALRRLRRVRTTRLLDRDLQWRPVHIERGT